MISTALEHGPTPYCTERVPGCDEIYTGGGPASIPEPGACTCEVGLLSEVVRRTCSGALVDIACGIAFWLPSYAAGCGTIAVFDQSPRMLAEGETSRGGFWRSRSRIIPMR